MKQIFLGLSLLFASSLFAITDNVELIANGGFSSNVTGTPTVSLSSTAGTWYANDTIFGGANTKGFTADASTGAFVTSTVVAPTNVFDNFLGQITTDATVNSGRYRLSITASGNQPFYIKISSTSVLGTELTYSLKNPSSSAIEKQGTPDYSGYSLKITPTGTTTTYTGDLYLSNSTPSAIRVLIVFPKAGTANTVDDISFKRLGNIPTSYYLRPTGSTLWTNLLNAGGIISDQIVEGNAISIDGTYTYYMAPGNYTTGGLTVTSGKIYGGFSGNETAIDLSTRPTSDLDGNGIVEPWEFTNETNIKSSQANSSFTAAGTSTARLLVVSGNGGEVNGVTLNDFNYTTFGGPITLGKATTPAAADTVSTLAGTLRLCTVRKIKSALAGSIVMNNPYSLIDRCLIESTVNSAANSGGAISIVSFGGKVEGSVIRNNLSSAATGRGGAIYIASSSSSSGSGNINAIVRNCLIYNNGSTQGGALRIDGISNKRGVQIINSTIVNNKSAVGGSGTSPATVEFISCGAIVNSIVVNPSLSETGTEIRINAADSYLTKTIYGDSTYTSGGVKSGTVKSKITSDISFTNPTTFSGVSIPDYTSPWDATAIANYNAIRQANFTIKNSSSLASVIAGATSLPASYSFTGGAVTFTTTVPTTDILAVTRTGNYTLGAYQLDVTAPTTTLSSSSAAVTGWPIIPVTITFSEPVVGFDISDVVVTNGTKSDFTAVSSTVYSLVVNASTVGTVTVDVAGAVAKDFSGNNNAVATQLTRTYDLATTINGATAKSIYVNRGAKGFTVNGLSGVNTIAVYNANGVLQNSVTSSDNSVSIPGLSKGIYVLKIKTANGTQTVKAVY